MIKKCFKATIVFLCFCLCMSSSVFALDTIVMSPVSVEGTGGYTEIYIDDVLCPADALPDGLVSENGYLKSNKTLKDSKIAVDYYPETENTTYEVFVYQPSTQSTNTDKMLIEVQHAEGVETVDYNLQQGTEGYFSLGIFLFSTDETEKITITKPAGTSAIKQYAYWGDVKLVPKKIKEKTGVVILDEKNANNDPDESGRVEISGGYSTVANENAYGGSYIAAPNKAAITVNYYPRLEAGTYSVYTYKKWFSWGSIRWNVNDEISGTLNTDKREIVLNGGWHHLGDATFSGEYGVDFVSFYRESGMEGTGCADALIFIPKVNVKTMSFAYNNSVEENPEVLPPSADVLKMEFNYVLSDLTTDNVTLKGPGGAIDIVCVQDGSNVFRVVPKVSLEKNTKYTLTVSIYDVVLKKDNPLSYSFTTNDSDESMGGEVTIDAVTYENRMLTINGVVYSSSGETMGNREVALSLISPEDVRDENVATVVSDANGAYTFEHMVADYEEDGVYKVEIKAQYIDVCAESKFSYVTGQTETEFLSELEKTEDETKVKEVFDSFTELLDLDAYKTLSDTNAFLKHFILADFENMDSFRLFYDQMLVFEELNQAISDSVVTNILSSEEKCKLIGIKYGILDLLPNVKNEFVTAVRSLEQFDDAEDFLTAYLEVENAYLLKENNMDTVDTKLKSIELNKGQSAELKIEFSEEQKNVKEIRIFVQADMDVLEDLHVTDAKDAEVETNVEDNSAEIVVTYEKALQKVTTPFAICFTPVGDTDFEVHLKITGAVVYENAENPAFGMTADLEDKEITVSVEKKGGSSSSSGGSHSAPSSGGGSFGGGGGGGSSSGSGSSGSGSNTGKVDKDDKVEKDDKEEKPEVPEKTEPVFTDIADVAWAEESILALHKAGIITGSGNQLFEPNREITRAEFIKMVVVAAGLYDSTLESSFTDSDKNQWFDSYIASAQKYGIAQGKGDGSFGVNDHITREDAATMIMRTLSLGGIDYEASTEKYDDDASISAYAYDAVYKLSGAGVLNGMGDNLFMPSANLTRAMAAKIIHSLTVENNK